MLKEHLVQYPQLSLSARRAWIEISSCQCSVGLIQSLSARRAWIEIGLTAMWCRALRSLSARRAWIEIVKMYQHSTIGSVALRKESVDRNQISGSISGRPIRSLSARRAWIEMLPSAFLCSQPYVALRKESVDRNGTLAGRYACRCIVALRKESVDRNGRYERTIGLIRCRSPQGERG